MDNIENEKNESENNEDSLEFENEDDYDESSEETHDNLEKIQSENESLKEELSKFNDKYLRLAAEYKNYQERSRKEKMSIRRDSLIDAVSSVLPIIDDIERTLPSFSEAGEKYAKGVSMILKRVDGCLKSLEVESFGEVGEEFDPSIHNASSKIESDDEKTVISAVYQKGYRIKDKLVRPAMVQVKG